MGFLKGKSDPVRDEEAPAPAWGEDEWAAFLAKWARYDAMDKKADDAPDA